MIKITIAITNNGKFPIYETEIQRNSEKEAIDLYRGIKSYIDRKLREEYRIEKDIKRA